MKATCLTVAGKQNKNVKDTIIPIVAGLNAEGAGNAKRKRKE
jgi:hypothetical protein